MDRYDVLRRFILRYNASVALTDVCFVVCVLWSITLFFSFFFFLFFPINFFDSHFTYGLKRRRNYVITKNNTISTFNLMLRATAKKPAVCVYIWFWYLNFYCWTKSLKYNISHLKFYVESQVEWQHIFASNLLLHNPLYYSKLYMIMSFKISIINKIEVSTLSKKKKKTLPKWYDQ